MSLLCRLGRHRPRGIPRWNDGFYFARCEQCGRDLVRTAFEGWHEPRGYKVVWSVSPPAGRPEVALTPKEKTGEPGERPTGHEAAPAIPAPPEAAPDRSDAPAPSPVQPPEPEPQLEPLGADDPAPVPMAAPAGGPQKVRLPIQDVLAHLQAQDSAEPAGEAPPAPVRTRRSTWDFMDDDPVEGDPVSGPEPGRIPGNASGAEALDSAERGAEEAPTGLGQARSGERLRKLRSAVRNFWSGPAEPRPVLVGVLALAVAASVALALYSAGYPAPGSPPGRQEASALPGGGAAGSGPGLTADPFAASAPHVSPGQAVTSERQQAVGGSAPAEVAYVAASLLICRAAPVPKAERVRNLLRGREVRVLGYDGAWASLAYGGGQCWAQAQYLSPVPPL